MSYRVVYKDKEVWQNDSNCPDTDFLYAICIEDDSTRWKQKVQDKTE